MHTDNHIDTDIDVDVGIGFDSGNDVAYDLDLHRAFRKICMYSIYVYMYTHIHAYTLLFLSSHLRYGYVL